MRIGGGTGRPLLSRGTGGNVTGDRGGGVIGAAWLMGWGSGGDGRRLGRGGGGAGDGAQAALEQLEQLKRAAGAGVQFVPGALAGLDRSAAAPARRGAHLGEERHLERCRQGGRGAAPGGRDAGRFAAAILATLGAVIRPLLRRVVAVAADLGGGRGQAAERDQAH